MSTMYRLSRLPSNSTPQPRWAGLRRQGIVTKVRTLKTGEIVGGIPFTRGPLAHLLRGKQHGTMRKTKHRGLASVATDFMLNLIAYNLIRIPKLLAA